MTKPDCKTNGEGPLAGLRVLEICHFVPLPFVPDCSAVFGHLLGLSADAITALQDKGVIA